MTFESHAGQAPMSLFPTSTSPFDDVWVSLDIETTGLSRDSDEIIEIGAVKFRGDETIDTFHTLVNPHRRLGSFVKRYTGITQAEVDRAPPFSSAAGELVPFLGSTPIVGHNVAFDLGFLASQGLRLSNPKCDTWDLAFVLLTARQDLALPKLAASFGIPHERAHRALHDARATQALFLRLAEMASDLDAFTLAEMGNLASRSRWVLSDVLASLATSKIESTARAEAAAPTDGAKGFDIQDLRQRLRHMRALRPNRDEVKIDVDDVAEFLQDGGHLARAMPGFEERPEQISMARAVSEAINEGKRLAVEAGTGVGKSLAYLLPAALYALANNRRVVVSTNTINLQEQLLTKDVPSMVKALELAGTPRVEEFSFTQLKGRANYLCLKRWALMRGGDSLSEDEARLLSKIMMWLRTTPAGDRSELNMGNRASAAPWDRLSAQGAIDCNGLNGVCFLRAARDRSAAAHLLIVNHALLMSDLIAGRALIPDYDLLIIDEAHHLEEVATRHLGFEQSQARFGDQVQALGGDRGLLNRVSVAFRGSSAAESRRATTEEVVARIAGLLPKVRDEVARMYGVIGVLMDQSSREHSEMRVTGATRTQPAWSDLEIQWENADASLAELERELTALNTSLEGLDQHGLQDYEALVIETLNALTVNAELRQQLSELVSQPKDDTIYWVSRSARSGDLTLHAAPIHVGEQLDKLLFSQKESVVLTSATLSTAGSFDHIRERTSFDDADELLLGSPFDYPRAAKLCVPSDIPEPSLWEYQAGVEHAVTSASLAAQGRTMALFTSHAALRKTASAIRGDLESRGLDVLAQGVDGTPYQLLESFLDNPRSVLLGTASFWEGVDLAGESLKVLLLARLPFSVPTEPVFEARSELYEDSFDAYAVPQAILRTRQGFGRLIRTKSDRGVVVILDRRIVSRRYGKAFRDSLPPVTFKSCKLMDLGDEVRSWI